jgi:hypothetical protein
MRPSILNIGIVDERERFAATLAEAGAKYHCSAGLLSLASTDESLRRDEQKQTLKIANMVAAVGQECQHLATLIDAGLQIIAEQN